MTVTNIKQEILDWYNEPIEEGDVKETRISNVWEEFYYSLSTKANCEKYDYKTGTLESGPAYIEEDFGGEGQGETRYVVFSVDGQFFRVDGYYASWDGTNWESASPYEVEAKEVTVIKYERKK